MLFLNINFLYLSVLRHVFLCMEHTSKEVFFAGFTPSLSFVTTCLLVIAGEGMAIS